MADSAVVKNAENSKTRKEWRKLVKKLQRKRRRQKAAQARDEEEAAKLKDPEYQELLRRQRELAAVQRIAAEQQHQEDEEAWLRRELLAQRQFAREQKEREAKEALEREKRLQQVKELEERQARLRLAAEERKRKEAEAAAEFERTMERMNEYLAADVEMEPPQELQRIVESRPGAKVCEFFERTNCCRFGLPCVFSHRRPLLSSIIVIRHFFTHPLLEQSTGNGDISESLENTEQDLRKDYDEFFNDVVPELETFGKILNFRTVRNTWAHLRGHVFIEYLDNRSALKAFIALQGRYYASKRLNVEFSNLRSWRGAICVSFPRTEGLSVIRKCSKGNNCSYLHLFKNPDNKYNTPLEYTQPATPSVARQMMSQTPSRTPILTPLLSWNEIEKNEAAKEPSRNWRWSESPEPESEGKPTHGDQPKDPEACKSKQEPHKRSSSRSSRSESKKKRSRSRERASRKRKKHKSKSKSRDRLRRK